MSDNAENARRELKKAREAQEKKDFTAAEKHLDNAEKKLAPPEKTEKPRQQAQPASGKEGQTPAAPAKADPGAADDKKLEFLNDANRNMQQRHRNSQQHLRRGPMLPVEKDW